MRCDPVSLRDEIAVEAMKGMLSNPNNALTDKEIADSAYSLADEMLKHIDPACPVCRQLPGTDGKIIHESGCTWGWEV